MTVTEWLLIVTEWLLIVTEWLLIFFWFLSTKIFFSFFLFSSYSSPVYPHFSSLLEQHHRQYVWATNFSTIFCLLFTLRLNGSCVFWSLYMWITSIKSLPFFLMTFNASLSSYRERYLWYATECAEAFLILASVTRAHGPLTYHVIIFHTHKTYILF